jgi:hypothetical protein
VTKAELPDVESKEPPQTVLVELDVLSDFYVFLL